MKINDDIIVGIESSEESYFTHSGCDNCNNHLGNTVYDCKAFFDQPGRKTGENFDHYNIELCDSCLCAYHNGDELDDECKNVFNI